MSDEEARDSLLRHRDRSGLAKRMMMWPLTKNVSAYSGLQPTKNATTGVAAFLEC